MEWGQLAPSVLFGTALLLLPGMGLAFAAGARGAVLLVTAPALTMSLIAGLAIVLEWWNLPWDLATFTVGTLVVLVLVLLCWLLIRLVTGRWIQARIHLRWPSLIVGVGVAGAALTTALVVVFPSPTLFAQTFDNAFHLNAVQYILDTKMASSLTIQQMTTGAGAPGPYPAAWHAYVSLILEQARLMDSTMPVAAAVNAATLAVVIFAWCVGVLVLAQVVAGPSLSVGILTAAFISALPLFPWLYIEFGSVYPNLLGNSLLPGLIALLLLLRTPPPRSPAPTRAIIASHQGGARISEIRSSARRMVALGTVQLEGAVPRLVVCMLVLAAVPGTLLSHPNAAFALGLAIVVTGWAAYLPRLRSRAPGHPVVLVLPALVLSVITAGFVYAWVRFAPPSPTQPPAPIPVSESLIRLSLGVPAGSEATLALPVSVLTSAAGTAPTLALPLLLVSGLALCLWRRQVTYLLLALFPATIYVGSVSAADPAWARAFGGLFYQDPRRTAVFAFLLALPLALYPLGVASRAFHSLTQRARPWLLGQVLNSVLVVVLAAMIAGPTLAWSMGPHFSSLSARLTLPSKARYVNEDELALISRLRPEVPAGTKVLGDPGDGSAFIYALSGVPVVFPHFFTGDSPAMAQVRQHLFDQSQSAANCQMLRELNAFYFTDFGWTSKSFAGPAYFPGMAKVNRKLVELVDFQGTAKLYRITICDRQP